MQPDFSSSSRRGFLQTLTAGAALGPLALTLRPVQGASTSSGNSLIQPDLSKGEVIRTSGQVLEGSRLLEAAREIPIAGHSDVFVCGAGPAGVGAALAAARAGAKVRVMEFAGCLGGVWTAGLLTKILDAGNKTGIMKELLTALSERGDKPAKLSGGTVYDPELCKLILEEMYGEAGIKVQLHTQLVGAITDSRNRIVAVITESKSGRQAWTAERFIDCSGDGDLAAQAGCQFDVGMASTCECQPMSMMALLTGLDPKAESLQPFLRETGTEAKPRFLKLMKEAGINPSYRAPTLRHLHDGIFSIMTNHEYGVPASDAAQITDATFRSRAEVNGIVQGLKKLGGIWQKIALVATAEQLGVREGRRIKGRYTITAEDVARGLAHPDAVCRAEFGFDVHNIRPDSAAPPEFGSVSVGRARPYDIPLPALMSADIEGLMMAGRCISGDFFAHSSYRVTGNSVPMGEAAGLVSAISLQRGVMPHELMWRDIREQPLSTARKGADKESAIQD